MAAQVFLQRHREPPPCRFDVVAIDGERLQWLRARGFKLDTELAETSVDRGDERALEVLLQDREIVESLRRPSTAKHVSGVAASRCHVPLLRARLRVGAFVGAHCVVRAVSGAADLELGYVRWTPEWSRLVSHQRDSPLFKREAEAALAVLRWVEQEAPDGAALVAAALCGDDAVGRIMPSAARMGSVALVSWLRDRGCAWDESDLVGAAGSGCVALLEWMVERGCPVPVRVQEQCPGECHALAAKLAEQALSTSADNSSIT